MATIYRVQVATRPAYAPERLLLDDIAALGVTGVRRVEGSSLYFLAGNLSVGDVQQLCERLLADPVSELVTWRMVDEPSQVRDGVTQVDVGYLPGVTDTAADNVMRRAAQLGIDGLDAVATGQSYLILGDLAPEAVHEIARRLLCNEVIQYYQVGDLVPHLSARAPGVEIRAQQIPLEGLGDEDLLALSRERLLSLDLAEMHAIQAYFAEEGRDPTDVELESLAQTWSEHCVHKTFRGVVDYEEQRDDGVHRERIDSLLRTYLRAATEDVSAPWVRSAFVDNAGILAFTDAYDVSIKVETHNHPSALEPFGGANTGVGGVVRDIMGVSAKPIANTDVLCFGPLETPWRTLPAGVLHPRRIYEGVVAGVEDYGNKMGIPTVNGAIVFERGYTANPLVYCGCVGIAPRGSHPNGACADDLVVVLGGRTGRDGLHGATFSSAELTHETGQLAGGAVQIGNPITEKMVLDAILVARDERLYTAITDCGAGGLSSAVSEMGRELGVTVELDRVPLKYQGLQPWEIWLSEAQERMVLAVPPENEPRLREICEGLSVEMTVIGVFREDGRLLLRYDGITVADIAMDFLHDGLPRRQLKAVWRYPTATQTALPDARLDDHGEALLKVLAHPNVRSKEDVVRRYDHEVQGATVLKPFVGASDDGPSDAAVIRPLETFDQPRALALGCGFAPAYGEQDPYAMAVACIDEAVRNVVAVGADPERIAILDNFCWGDPLKPDRLGALVRACKGCYAGATLYGVPFVSGKDSLNNEYLDGSTGERVAIPPSLLITALGIVPEVAHTCTMDLKRPDDLVYVLGMTRQELGGSYYGRVMGLKGGIVPQPADWGPAVMRVMHGAIQEGLVAACHDCSEGGLAVALAEMCIAGRLGITGSLKAQPAEGNAPHNSWLLFAETNARFIVEVAPEHQVAFERVARDVPHGLLGYVTEAEELFIEGRGGEPALRVTVKALRQAWRGHAEAVMGEVAP
ncbi:MAG: phosphoribosylformylglycinamidine synthase subunit PurL [Anaerolineae bacterium]|nr:phosphoribosylformylglycinamidine synthase subunit PurL [Anaerolineae bacterium]